MQVAYRKPFALPDGSSADIGVIEHVFTPWTGQAPPRSYGTKPIVTSCGRGVFAEIAIVELFLAEGWAAAWASTYGGLRFFVDQPLADRSNSVHLPEPIQGAIGRITALNHGTAGMFDVVAWSGDDLVFLEAKRARRDRIRETQRRWVQAGLEAGFTPKHFAIFEWTEEQ